MDPSGSSNNPHRCAFSRKQLQSKQTTRITKAPVMMYQKRPSHKLRPSYATFMTSTVDSVRPARCCGTRGISKTAWCINCDSKHPWTVGQQEPDAKKSAKYRGCSPKLHHKLHTLFKSCVQTMGRVNSGPVVDPAIDAKCEPPLGPALRTWSLLLLEIAHYCCGDVCQWNWYPSSSSVVVALLRTIVILTSAAFVTICTIIKNTATTRKIATW